MPVKLRQAKARARQLTLRQYWELVIGGDGAFDSDDDHREAWRIHRDRLLANAHPGHRPAGWWQYESSSPRDPDMVEALQLYRMGALAGGELETVMAAWREWEHKAAGGLHYARGPGDFLRGEAAYIAWCDWAGVPEEMRRGLRTVGSAD